MNYTTNYHLPQWVESDRIMMGDFNEAMDTLDTELAAAQAVTDVAYTPDNKPYTIGSYTGNGNTITITLGFRPSFLLISGDVGSTSLVSHYQQYGYHVGFVSDAFVYDTITLTDTGFKIVRDYNNYPQWNEGNHKYIYIAFR